MVVFDLLGRRGRLQGGTVLLGRAARSAVRRRERAAAAHLRRHVTERARCARPLHAPARQRLQALARRASDRGRGRRRSSRREASSCPRTRTSRTCSSPAGSGSPCFAACSATSPRSSFRTGSRSSTRTATASPPRFSTSSLELEQANPNLQVVLTMTDDPAWDGETRRIDAELLRDHLGDDLESLTYLIAGPPAMVEGVVGDAAGRGCPRGAIPARPLQRLLAADGDDARVPGSLWRVDLDLVPGFAPRRARPSGRVRRDAADARDLDRHPLTLLVLDLDRRADADLATCRRLVLDEHGAVATGRGSS